MKDGQQDGIQEVGLLDGMNPGIKIRRQAEIFILATMGAPLPLLWHTPMSGMGTPGPVRRMADAKSKALFLCCGTPQCPGWVLLAQYVASRWGGNHGGPP